MVKNNCQLNLFQEESPYEQSFFIMYFVVHLMRESQGNPFEWKAGDSYVQLINIDKKDFLILKNLLGKLKYSSYIKVVNYFVNTIFSEFSEKEKMKSVNKYEEIYPTVHFHLLIAKKKTKNLLFDS